MSTFCKSDCADPVAQSREGCVESTYALFIGDPDKNCKARTTTRDRALFKSVEINRIVYFESVTLGYFDAR